MAGEDRTLTGIDGLDRLTKGGLPHGSATLLVGSAGTGKSTFCTQFAKTGVNASERVIFVCSGQPIGMLVASLKEKGFSAEDLKSHFVFIDLYSWRAPEDQEGGGAGLIIKRPSDLNDLMKSIKDAMSTGARFRIIVDSISDSFLSNPETSVFKFAQLLVASVRARGGACLITLEEGVHPAAHEKTLEYILDNVIRMKMDGGKRMLSIVKMRSTPHPLNWIEYTLHNEISLKVSSALDNLLYV